jgi:transposase
MDFILEVYRIERAVLDADLLGTPEHLVMRQTRSRAVMDGFMAWLDAEQPRHPPRDPYGREVAAFSSHHRDHLATYGGLRRTPRDVTA